MSKREFKTIQNWTICGDRTYKDYLKDEIKRFTKLLNKSETIEDRQKWQEAINEVEHLISIIVD